MSDEKEFKILHITYVHEIDGQEVQFFPVSEKDVQAAGLTDECSCGEERCIDGYVWRCALDRKNQCRWFSSRWRCNG